MRNKNRISRLQNEKKTRSRRNKKMTCRKKIKLENMKVKETSR